MKGYRISPFHHTCGAVPRGWWADGVGFPKRAKSSFGVPSSWGRRNAAANLCDVLLGEQLSEPPSGREVDFAKQKTEGECGHVV